MFDIGKMRWTSNCFRDHSAYDGTLRYFSVCFVPNRKVYMTGGCYTTNAQPSSSCFAIDLWYITDKPIMKKNMIMKRYGHQCQYLNGLMYIIGGFNHRDLPNEQPVTLASCERYQVIDNSWAHISTMQEPRAFASSVVLDSQYIYVFGGMHDLQILSTIEKYDTITDTWITVFFTLPKPLAKMGASLIDRKSILICGGMSSDFEAKKDVFSFDLNE